MNALKDIQNDQCPLRRGGGEGSPTSAGVGYYGMVYPCEQNYKQTQNVTFPHTLCAGGNNAMFCPHPFGHLI